MNVASRTPEGFPSNCPLCGAASKIEFSQSSGDAPCPNCGHLLWESSELFDRVQKLVLQMHSADSPPDSLDVVELVMGIEEEFDVVVPDDEYDQFKTIADVVRFLMKNTRKGPPSEF